MAVCCVVVVFQAFVFDFGSEMYLWTGKHVPLDIRRHVLKLATDRWQSGYDYSEFPVNPLSPLTRQFHFSFQLYRFHVFSFLLIKNILLSLPSERSEWRRYCFRSTCVCLSVCAQRTGQSDQFKTLKATDFKFDVHVPTDNPDVTP